MFGYQETFKNISKQIKCKYCQFGKGNNKHNSGEKMPRRKKDKKKIFQEKTGKNCEGK